MYNNMNNRSEPVLQPSRPAMEGRRPGRAQNRLTFGAVVSGTVSDIELGPNKLKSRPSDQLASLNRRMQTNLDAGHRNAQSADKNDGLIARENSGFEDPYSAV